MMLFALIVAIIPYGSAGPIRFFESENTFAEYRPWELESTGNIRFDFKTYKKNALLLYCDGGLGSTDFLKIQLVNQQLVVQANYGNYKIMFTIGSRLSDGKFHTIIVKVTPDNIRGFLDTQFTKEAVIDKTYEGDTIKLKSMTYVGGVSKYTTGLVEKYMANEPRFTGCIDNLKFTRPEGKIYGSPSLKENSGIGNCTESNCDRTTAMNSCINGGLCEANQEGFSCLCEGTGYTGQKCAIGKFIFQVFLA